MNGGIFIILDDGLVKANQFLRLDDFSQADMFSAAISKLLRVFGYEFWLCASYIKRYIFK